jgi:hypothetical protein
MARMSHKTYRKLEYEFWNSPEAKARGCLWASPAYTGPPSLSLHLVKEKDYGTWEVSSSF